MADKPAQVGVGPRAGPTPWWTDRDAAERFLVRAYGSGVEMAEALAQGEWSCAYAFRHRGRDLVVRFNSDRQAFDLDVFAERFRSPDVPIPKVLTVGGAPDGFFAISERAFGQFLEELEPEHFAMALPAVTRLLAGLQAADTSGTQGYGPWDAANGDGLYKSWREYLLDVGHEIAGRPAASWRPALESSSLALTAFNRGMQVLGQLVPECPDSRAVVHSDLLNRNVLVRDAAVSAVIDWQCAMYGDQLYDLAWFTFWAPWHAGVAAAEMESCAAGTNADVRMCCYEVHIGVRHLIYNAWRRGGGPDLEAVARRTLDVLEGLPTTKVPGSSPARPEG